MKRIWLFLGLALMLVFSTAVAGKLPAEARFDAVIKGVLFPPDPKQLSPTKPLDLVLEALAKSVGLQTLIYREYDDKGTATVPRIPNIKFDFQGKKFRDIWDLLFNTYGLQLGLDYVVLGNNTIVVAPNELISGLSDATKRTGESQRQLYLVDIPAATYVDKEGKADYDKAKLWVKDNFIPFANREFGGLAINWLVVEGGKLVSIGSGKSETAVEVAILRVLVSVLSSESQQLRFQETLARARYGFELLPTALELAAIQAASSPPEEPEKPTERIFTLRNINFAEISGFLITAIPGLSVSPLPTNPAAALLKGTPTQLRRVSDLLPQLDIARPTTPETPLLDRTIALKNVAFADVREFLVGQLPKVVVAPVPTNPKVAVVRASEADFIRLNELIAVVDLPKLISAEQERQLYLVDIPASSYQVQSSVQVQDNGRTETRSETRSDYDKAKTWVRDNFLTFANREFESPATNWIVVEVGQTLKLLASIVASPAQQIRFQETLIRSRFGFEILPSADLNRPTTPENENRVITLKYVGFATIKSFLEGQLPKISIAISPTNPGLAIVRGSPTDLDQLNELLKIVDVPQPAPGQVVESIVTTQHVGTASIKDFLLSLLPKLSISPSPTNPNLAIVRGSQLDLDKLADLLKVIDVPKVANPGPANLERIFTTQASLFPDIKDFLAANLPSVSISVSPNNPRLALVRGTQPDLDKLAELLKIVDTPKEGSVQLPTLEVVITTQHVPVASFKDFILAQLPKLALSPSPTNPKLAVVRGTQPDLDKLAELIKLVDVPQPTQPTPENPIEQTVTLKNIPFSDVRDFLTAAVPGISINILPTKPNAAVVKGYAAQITRVVELLGQVDLARPLASEPVLLDRVVTLKNAVFLEVREFLLGQLPKVVLAASPTNPRLAVVRGTQADLDKLVELIKLVDVAPPAPPAAEPPSERLFTLKNSGFETIKDFLQAAVPGLVVQVLPTNPRSALLRGSQAQLKRVDELLPQVDIAPIVPGPSTAAAVVKPYALNTLSYADLNRLYQQSFRVYLPNTTLREVTATPGAFTLEATPEQHQLFADLLAKIDRPETARLSEQVQVVPLTQADPSRVARMVRQYYPNTTLSVVGRSLVFKATPLDTAGLIQLINRLDAPAPEQKVFPLYTRDTASLELALRRALLARGLEVNVSSAVTSASPAPNLNDEALTQLQLAPASVELLPASQRILVTGSASLIELVGQLLPTLDPPPATVVEAAPLEQVFTLQNGSFASVRDFLLGQLPRIALAVVPTNPKLALVRGTAAELERLKVLLELVDVAAPVALPADAPRLRQVYTLQYVPARTVIASLKEFLNRELPGARLEEIPGNPSAVWFEGIQAQVTEFDRLLKAVDVRPPTPPVVLERRSFVLSFADPAQVAQIVQRDFPGSTVDIVGKQLIVRAQPAQLAEMTGLLSSLDVARPSLVQKTYLLSHAQATALAPVLTEAVGARSQAASNSTSTPAAAANNANPTPAISIVADERTNALVVTGEASLVALVDELVTQLDLPVAQVNIQVRVQEVTSSVVNNLGLRWETVAGGNILTSLLETGLSLIFDSTRSLASLNLRVTLDALQEQGLSRTLNDSNITVLNNQTGRIQSGQTIFLRQTQQGTDGQRSGATEQVPFEIGVIVEVTPRIAADGSIVMQIVTDISGSNLQRNPTDGLIDRFDRQSSSSSLRIKDGQTIVLGGLIQKRSGQNSTGIPLLSEIPLLGSLFKQQKFEDSDRELLIVITGNIVKDAPTNRR